MWPKEPLGKLIEVVVAFAALEKIRQDHGIGHRTGHLNAGAGEDQHIVLDVLTDLFDRRVEQDRLECLQGGGLVEALENTRSPDRQIIRLARLPAKRDPDQARAGRVKGCGLRVDTESGLADQLSQKCTKRFRVYRRVDTGLPIPSRVYRDHFPTRRGTDGSRIPSKAPSKHRGPES